MQELAPLRAAVLKMAGAQVAIAKEGNQYLSLLSEPHWDVLVLCFSVRQCKQVAEAFRSSHPSGRVVVTLETNTSHPCATGDAYVCGIDGPEALIKAVLHPAEA